MRNLPTYDVNNFSIGRGILYLGPPGATPTVDVGIVLDDSILYVKRRKESIKIGGPEHVIEGIATAEDVFFETTAIEWNLSNLSRALGAGITTHTAALETFSLGGESTFDRYSFLFKHTTNAGDTIDIKLWEVCGGGRTKGRLAKRLHRFSYSFEALDVETDWAGNNLGEDRRLFEIERDKSQRAVPESVEVGEVFSLSITLSASFEVDTVIVDATALSLSITIGSSVTIDVQVDATELTLSLSMSGDTVFHKFAALMDEAPLAL